MTLHVTPARIRLVTFLVAGNVLAYVGCVFLPGTRSIASLRKELESKQTMILTVNRQATSLIPLEQQRAAARKHVEQWAQNSPRDANLVELLGKLAGIAAEEGVRLNRLSPQETVDMATLRQHPLRLELEADFEPIMNFLGRLEGLRQTNWVRQIQIRPCGQNRASVQCELTITVFADNREISG